MKDNLLASLKNCTFVKTLLMLLVILYHSCIYWTNQWFMPGSVATPSAGLATLAKWLNSFHISCFTLVSGYIFYYLRYERNKYQKFIPFLINKGKRLLIPYFFTAVVWVIPISIQLRQLEYDQIINNYFLGISPSQLWFLLMLFWVFVIAWFISDLFEKRSFVSFIVVIIIYLLGRKLSGILPNIYCIFTAFQYLLYFYIGFQIRKYPELKSHIIIWCIGAVSLFWISNYLIELPDIMNTFVEIILPLVGAISAFYFLQFMADIFRWKNSRNFGKLSSYSMPMYLFHQQIIYFVIIRFNGKVSPYINAMLNFTIALVGSYIISKILMKYKITKFLIGEK